MKFQDVSRYLKIFQAIPRYPKIFAEIPRHFKNSAVTKAIKRLILENWRCDSGLVKVV
jgi:hypothetical protein